MGQEAERAEMVIDRDDHDAVRRELGAVVVAGANPDQGRRRGSTPAPAGRLIIAALLAGA